MKHIRQINSVGTNSYTIVNLNNYIGELEDHPIFIDYSDLFEISEDELPNYLQYVNFEADRLGEVLG